jgi:hypothetical protein
MNLASFLFIFAMLLISLSSSAKAQALPAASRAPIQVGVAWSFASSDYGYDYIKGVTAFGDVGLSKRFSLEADVHYTSLSTPDGVGEDTYLVGPRYSIALEDRANVYVKALGGVGLFVFESPTFASRSSTYGVAAFGGGIEYRATPRINIRAIDIEYQAWPGFPPNGLSPFVTTIGFAYVH